MLAVQLPFSANVLMIPKRNLSKLENAQRSSHGLVPLALKKLHAIMERSVAVESVLAVSELLAVFLTMVLVCGMDFSPMLASLLVEMAVLETMF